MQAVDEFVLRQLVDVLLEREIDEPPAVRDERPLLNGAHLLAGHALAQPALDLGMLEVEEVARVVPDEAVPLDRLAVAADLAIGLENEVVLALQERGGGEPRHSGTHDEVANRFHSRVYLQPLAE